MYERYVALRDKAHYTDYYVSKSTGINRACFTLWKKGATKPSRASLERLSRFFKVKINYFYGD